MDRAEAARELGLSWSATSPEVEQAFRAAARRRHPDVGGHPTEFRRALEAREVLLAAGPPHPVERVVDAVVRYHPALLLLDALARAVDRRLAPR